ncbi:hypothetical protein [Yeosuana marina]|uniref:hypothetical protein n=1 Tax=Yeosuana marina TaxID=1565536 RepID=UPI00141F4548|nr:hypothetical protein [Yeosuana marina]
MKNYISYVIQDAKEHTHHSEIIDIISPPYTYSSAPEVTEVFKWAENKRLKLLPDQKLIITNMFKI